MSQEEMGKTQIRKGKEGQGVEGLIGHVNKVVIIELVKGKY